MKKMILFFILFLPMSLCGDFDFEPYDNELIYDENIVDKNGPCTEVEAKVARNLMIELCEQRLSSYDLLRHILEIKRISLDKNSILIIDKWDKVGGYVASHWTDFFDSNDFRIYRFKFLWESDVLGDFAKSIEDAEVLITSKIVDGHKRFRNDADTVKEYYSDMHKKPCDFNKVKSLVAEDFLLINALFYVFFNLDKNHFSLLMQMYTKFFSCNIRVDLSASKKEAKKISAELDKERVSWMVQKKIADASEGKRL